MRTIWRLRLSPRSARSELLACLTLAFTLIGAGHLAAGSRQQKASESQESKQPPTFRFESNDFLVALTACSRSAQREEDVICSGTVRNKAAQVRRFGFDGDHQVVDDQGNQYKTVYTTQPVVSFRLGNTGVEQQLEADLPLRFWLVVRNVSPDARSLTLIFYIYGEQLQNTKVVWRNVPLQK